MFALKACISIGFPAYQNGGSYARQDLQKVIFCLTENAANAGTGGATGQPGVGARTATPAGLGGLTGLGSLGFPDLGAAGGMGMMDPALVQQMLQNPAILQMMQGLLSNPQYINQVISSSVLDKSLCALISTFKHDEFLLISCASDHEHAAPFAFNVECKSAI